MNQQTPPKEAHRIQSHLPPPNLIDTSKANQSRAGVVFTLFHQMPNEPPFTVDVRYGRVLESEEQPYQRKIVLTEEWVKLDHGWLRPRHIGQLVVKNDEGRFTVVPTEEEKKEMANKIVELGIITVSIGTEDSPVSPQQTIFALGLVRPGEVSHFEPTDTNLLYLRSYKGKTRCTISLLPS